MSYTQHHSSFPRVYDFCFIFIIIYLTEIVSYQSYLGFKKSKKCNFSAKIIN